jgi:transposase
MNDEISSDIRSQRGLALARSEKDSIKPLVGTKYLVPSAASNGSTYVVDTDPKHERCSCLDWSKLGGHERPHRCKHLWAVIHVLKLADGSELLMPERLEIDREPRKKYPRNRKAENRCRTLIPHFGPHYCELLVDGLGLRGRVIGENGRPEVPLRDVFLVALIRAFYNLTAGGAVERAQELWDAGRIHLTKMPSYNTLLRVFAEPTHMVMLHRLLAGSALPLIGLEEVFAIDGTGFGSSVYDHHHTQKHGSDAAKRKPTIRHTWTNATLVFGVRTLCVAAAQLTDKPGECPLMPELVRRVIANGGRIVDWCGDAAYTAWYNVVAVEQAGGSPFFDWPRGVTGKTRPETLGRLYSRFRDDQDLYWSHYGKRSLSESGINVIKTRFGHSLRSRTTHAQYAELMLRLVCHNVAQLIQAIEKFDIDPRYWAQDLIATLPDFGTVSPPDSALVRIGAKPSETAEVE